MSHPTPQGELQRPKGALGGVCGVGFDTSRQTPKNLMKAAVLEKVIESSVFTLFCVYSLTDY
jgi:hypothetical protein